MSKVNAETIISDRLLEMSERTKGLKRQPGNLYEHLCQLLSQMPLSNDGKNRKIDSVKELAAISEYIKKCGSRQKQAEPLPQDKLKEVISHREKSAEWFVKKQELLAYHAQMLGDSLKVNVEIQDFQQSHSTLFSTVGVSFGNEQALRISVGMRKLRNKVHAVKMRFWGKILTRSSDYYVIQGVVKKDYDQHKEPDMQKYSEGVNGYSYWVNSLQMQSEWYELPLVTPEQVKVARQIKYMFSGDIKSQVKSYPAFPGTEAHLLKAQIARITHNCQITPKGMYAPTEQNPDEIQFAEEFKLPDYSQLGNLQNWVHLNPYILEMGRCSYWVDPKLSQEQREQLIGKLNESDPRPERLRQVNEDKPAQGRGVETSWFVKTLGSQQVYNNVGKDQGTTSCYGLITIKNANWPGWLTVADSKTYDSVYIGYGWKATQSILGAIRVEDLQIEGQDAGEIEQPNPRNPPDELEPDSDDENKKPQE